MIDAINAYLAGMFPPVFWRVLEMTLGALVMLATVLQRTMTERFQSSGIACTIDLITTRVGQISLAVIGLIGLLIAIDGSNSNQQPRILVLMFLTSYFGIQVRIVYLAVRQGWRKITHAAPQP